jgi:hypothetical protein
MQVWIVFGSEPVAAFSSRERAEAFVTQGAGEDGLQVVAARVNPDAFGALTNHREVAHRLRPNATDNMRAA